MVNILGEVLRSVQIVAHDFRWKHTVTTVFPVIIRAEVSRKSSAKG